MTVKPSIPDRLSTEKGNRFCNNGIAGSVRISINAQEMVGCVAEYCISGGWARVYRQGPDGKNIPNVTNTGWAVRRVFGRVVVWWAADPVPPGAIAVDAGAAAALARALPNG